MSPSLLWSSHPLVEPAGAKSTGPVDLKPARSTNRHEEELARGRAFYNYEYVNPGLQDRSGDSVFARDDGGRIFHTYSTYGRGGEEFLGIYRYLDATPKGRGERGPYNTLADWARPGNMYGKGGVVEGSGRYHEPGCACTGHPQGA